MVTVREGSNLLPELGSCFCLSVSLGGVFFLCEGFSSSDTGGVERPMLLLGDVLIFEVVGAALEALVARRSEAVSLVEEGCALLEGAEGKRRRDGTRVAELLVCSVLRLS